MHTAIIFILHGQCMNKIVTYKAICSFADHLRECFDKYTGSNLDLLYLAGQISCASYAQ